MSGCKVCTKVYTKFYTKAQDFEDLVERYGLRYVIRNYLLDEETIRKIIRNEYSIINEEFDISEAEISEYQKCLEKCLEESLEEPNGSN